MKLSTVFGAAHVICVVSLIGVQHHVHEAHPTCEQASVWSLWLLCAGFFAAVGWLFAKMEA